MVVTNTYYNIQPCRHLYYALSQPHPSPPCLLKYAAGPKDWLKEQKRKSSKFLLAPIDASQQSLRSAYLLLVDEESTNSNKDLEDVQKLLKSAARDCVVQERNSLVAFQANTGVEVCTFRLIVKNASSFLEDKNPVKFEAEAMLDDLIRQRVADALMDTITYLDKI
ncbi:hypothetical protein REPUB_Repub02eG0032400 [Reevesia pubescens]